MDEKAYWAFLQEEYPNRYRAFYFHDAAMKCSSILQRLNSVDEFEALMSKSCSFMDPGLDTGDTLLTLASVMSSIVSQLEAWMPEVYVKTVLLATIMFCVRCLDI